jgi:hypothetical protein
MLISVWTDGPITRFLRAENMDANLREVFPWIGIDPEFTGPKSDGRPHAFHEKLRYERNDSRLDPTALLC